MTALEQIRAWIARISPWDPCRFWKEQAGLWQMQWLNEKARHEAPLVPFVIESGECVGQAQIVFAQDLIALSGLGHLVSRVAKVIEIVADPTSALEGEGGTIDADRRAIRMADRNYIPAWDLAGGIVHEAWHLWQFEHGMGHWPTAHLERQAYAVQQLFNLLSGHGGDNIFERNPVAKQLMMEVP